MAELKRLFSNGNIGSMELRNRICMGAIGGEGDEEGYYTDPYIDFYVERAKGGVALINIGGGCPDISGLFGKYGARLDDDKYIPRLTEMARRIHEASPGVKIGIQLFHVGRQMHVFHPGAMPGVTPVAPSAMKYRFGTVPHELTTEEVEFHVMRYVEAARRTREAGFDFVGLHGAHGYFISQFISPYTNKRTDKYGGNIENRARFACEIISGIKRECGRDFPVIIKISGEDFVASEPQIHIDHTCAVAPLLEQAGVDQITLSGGQHEAVVASACAPYFIPPGAYVDFAAAVRKVVRIPVGAVHGIHDPIFAEQILEEGKADFIWMCRPLIADPQFPIKAAEGRLDEIRPCISCCTCIGKIWEDWFSTTCCAVNPEAWREKKFHIMPAQRHKNILVIGGGPAGMEAARVAALIGHTVTLWEKDDKLGGQVNLASIAPHKDVFNNLISYYSVQMKRLGVTVELEKEATPALIEEMRPDVIIIATGATTLFPPVPGADKGIVVDARDVLTTKARVGDRVVVIGGGEVGMETAQILAEQGKKITMVVRTKMGKGMIRLVYHWIDAELKKRGVEMLTDTKTEEITDAGVVVTDIEQKKRIIEADTVVMAAGAKPDNALLGALEDLAPEIYLAGDCLYPGNIEKAIYQGATVARMTDAHLVPRRR